MLETRLLTPSRADARREEERKKEEERKRAEALDKKDDKKDDAVAAVAGAEGAGSKRCVSAERLFVCVCMSEGALPTRLGQVYSSDLD